MHNPIPAPIVVPAIGTPTCRGVALTVRPLTEWRAFDDVLNYSDRDVEVRVWATRAIRDGHVLCLRPTADRPACVGLSATAFAVSSLQDDFAARALVVDPYDAEGNDLRDPPTIQMRAAAGEHEARLAVDPPATATWSPERRMDAWRRYDEAKCVSVADMGPGLTAEEAHDVAVWEGSEAVTL